MNKIVFKAPFLTPTQADLVIISYPYTLQYQDDFSDKKVVIVITGSVMPLDLNLWNSEKELFSMMFKYVEDYIMKAVNKNSLKDEHKISFSYSKGINRIDRQIRKGDNDIKGKVISI